jgi:hypothetical protein
MLTPFHQTRFDTLKELETDLNIKFKGRGWYSNQSVSNTYFIQPRKFGCYSVYFFSGTYKDVKDRVERLFEEDVHDLVKP